MSEASATLDQRCVDPASQHGEELADFAAESVIVFDAGGQVRYWNAASEALYAWPARSMIGRHIGDVAINVSWHEAQWRLLLQEGAWEGVVRRYSLPGLPVAAAVRQIVRYDPAGHIRDVVEYGRKETGSEDTTGALDADLRNSVAAFWELDTTQARTILDAIASGTVDPAQRRDLADQVLLRTRIVDVNQRTVRLIGAFGSRDQMVGQSVAAFWPSDSRSVIADLIVNVATDPLNGAAQVRKFQSDGILRDPAVTVWRGAPDTRPDTIFVAVHGTAYDDRSFWHVRASEERYRKLLHHMPNALLQVDASHMAIVFGRLKADGVTDIETYLEAHPALVDVANDVVRITEVNRSAVAMLGGNAPADFIRPVGFLFAVSRGAVIRIMAARYRGQRNYAETAKLCTLDGRVIDARISLTFPTPPEQLDVTLISIDDITDRLRTETQLSQLQADFTRAARISTLGELATSIAHEVNQPLAAIVTNAETSLRWLSRTEPNVAKVEQLTARIVSNARRASEIVQRVRGMAAKREPERTPLNLNDVVDEALLFVRSDIESKTIDLSFKAKADAPMIEGDRVQLQQVIVNLLVNSMQAIEQSAATTRQIHLATYVDVRTVGFSIHDSGPGIAEENLSRVFDGFFTTKDEGMGIGLAVCHSIIVAHGGSMAVSNHRDRGAYFSFSLPLNFTHASC
jgi:two-component system, LuxR family, sensor kinase FixL